MKLSEIRQVLDERGIQLTKSLGQNFLHDANQLRRIAEAAALEPSDKVLEIGPGLGPLTGKLLEKAGEVLAIEKDARLVAVLRERFPTTQQAGAKLRLVHDDALEFLKHQPMDWTDWKMVSNLPYSVASPILVELAEAAYPPKRMVATLQLEVVRRLVAKAGDPDYGILTLLVGLQFETVNWFKIPSGCFFPEPEVDSGCICLERRPKPLLTEQALFYRVVKQSFSQRRKMMFKLLKEDWPPEQLERAFVELQLPLQARAESLTLEQFVALTRELSGECKRD